MRSRTNSDAGTRSTGQLPAVTAAKGGSMVPSRSDADHHVPLDDEVLQTHPQGAPQAPQPEQLVQVQFKLNCPPLPELPSCPDGKAVRQCLGGRGVPGGVTAFIVGGFSVGLPYVLSGHPEELAFRVGITAFGAFTTGLCVWMIESCAGPHCA